MNGTDLSGQQLDCAVFAELTMNQENLRGSQLPGANFGVFSPATRDAAVRGCERWHGGADEQPRWAAGH